MQAMNKELESSLSEHAQACDRPACKPAGRPKASEVEARLANLVTCAAQLFLRHGYSKVSLETIAREAHVAVRTIYVKFGGKPGLLKAAIEANRNRYFTTQELENDQRPLRQILSDFAPHLFDMVTTPEAMSMQRMVIAEAGSNPELTEVFMETGPRQTREILARLFNRPEIRAQLREDAPMELLPTFFTNCVIGDPLARFMFNEGDVHAASRGTLGQRLELFFRATLREP